MKISVNEASISDGQHTIPMETVSSVELWPGKTVLVRFARANATQGDSSGNTLWECETRDAAERDYLSIARCLDPAAALQGLDSQKTVRLGQADRIQGASHNGSSEIPSLRATRMGLWVNDKLIAGHRIVSITCEGSTLIVRGRFGLMGLSVRRYAAPSAAEATTLKERVSKGLPLWHALIMMPLILAVLSVLALVAVSGRSGSPSTGSGSNVSSEWETNARSATDKLLHGRTDLTQDEVDAYKQSESEYNATH